ncbi:MAG: DUF3617 domain-containing protein [Rubrivivax sp.]|nr:MAG: DUF3617 domain-containing protein [Rubrivivax sp.]
MIAIPQACRLVLLCCASLAGAATAQAQTAPPIKPGLWLVRSERAIDGQKAAPMGAEFDKLPPEVRQKMAAMMKQRGVDMSGGSGGIKLCLSKESLDQNQWMGEKSGPHACKTEFTSRTRTRWAWHSSCADPKSETDGEALFTSPESYTIKVANTMTMNGETRTTNMSNTSTWVGSNCGDLQPISAKSLGAPPPKPAPRP